MTDGQSWSMEIMQTTNIDPLRAEGGIVGEKRYGSVVEMARDTCGEEFATELVAYMAEREIIKMLIGARAVKGLTQADIARSMKCSAGKVARIENNEDKNLNIGDVRKYCYAVGLQLNCEVVPRD